MTILNFELFKKMIINKELIIDNFKDKYVEYNELLNKIDGHVYSNKLCIHKEFVKLTKFKLNELIDNCIIKTLNNKKDYDNLGLISEDIIAITQDIPSIIYKYIYYKTFLFLYQFNTNLNNKSDKIDYKTILINGNLNNYVKNKDFNKFDKIRVIHTYFTRNPKIFVENIYPDEYENYRQTTLDVVYSLYWICTKSNAIDYETKGRFYNELIKLWYYICETAYKNCTDYFVWYKQFKLKEFDKILRKSLGERIRKMLRI